MMYFHAFTKGLQDRQLFRNREDFIAGMNILAVVCSAYPQLKLLAFVLMSNHVHFVLYGNEKYAIQFINKYKNLVSRYVSNLYGETKYLRHLATTVSEVHLENEGLKRLIAYILNNPVKAGINCIASGYEWSSARCYFNQIDMTQPIQMIGDLSYRERIYILHSKKALPTSWWINSSGYVDPMSYIDYQHVQNVFGRSISMQYFMSATLSAKRGSSDSIVFSDTVIHTALAEILEKKYGVYSLEQLDRTLLKNLIRDLKVRFTASSKQIARIVGVPINDVVTMLDT